MYCKLNEQFTTLFLDRDGVINKHLPDDYVKNWDEFEFLPGVLNALAILSDIFDCIIIVTNQRGVGKGLMNEDDLKTIHERMLFEIKINNGRVDRIYYCTDVDKESLNRKPNSGMAFKAKNDFPNIDFKRSIMVGDSLSDMVFGTKLGMKTVLIDTNSNVNPNSLLNFAYGLTMKCE